MAEAAASSRTTRARAARLQA
eukprot:COSAG03_NODE_28103_length_229_cov_4.800000_2_plen_20_part_01